MVPQAPLYFFVFCFFVSFDGKRTERGYSASILVVLFQGVAKGFNYFFQSVYLLIRRPLLFVPVVIGVLKIIKFRVVAFTIRISIRIIYIMTRTATTARTRTIGTFCIHRIKNYFLRSLFLFLKKSEDMGQRLVLVGWLLLDSSFVILRLHCCCMAVQSTPCKQHRMTKSS